MRQVAAERMWPHAPSWLVQPIELDQQVRAEYPDVGQIAVEEGEHQAALVLALVVPPLRFLDGHVARANAANRLPRENGSTGQRLRLLQRALPENIVAFAGQPIDSPDSRDRPSMLPAEDFKKEH